MPDPTTPKVAFMGLGAMGKCMARNLANAGLLEVIWNRTASVTDELASALNVANAATPASAAERANVIFICVSADKDVEEIIHSITPALKPGSLVIDCSTIAMSTAIYLANQLKGVGADFVDAPVTGGVEGARDGMLSIMAGGSKSAVERSAPYFEAIGKCWLHMGDTGYGQAAKAINQAMCAGINQAVTESLALGSDLGLDKVKLIEAISGGAAGSWFLANRGLSMMSGQYSTGFKVSLHKKDLDICLKMAHGFKRNLKLVEMTAHDYAELIAAGYGDEDISALYRLKMKQQL